MLRWGPGTALGGDGPASRGEAAGAHRVARRPQTPSGTRERPPRPPSGFSSRPPAAVFPHFSLGLPRPAHIFFPSPFWELEIGLAATSLCPWGRPLAPGASLRSWTDAGGGTEPAVPPPPPGAPRLRIAPPPRQSALAGGPLPLPATFGATRTGQQLLIAPSAEAAFVGRPGACAAPPMRGGRGPGSPLASASRRSQAGAVKGAAGANEVMSENV